MNIYTYRIKTQEEYEAVKLRVEEGAKKLEGEFDRANGQESKQLDIDK